RSSVRRGLKIGCGRPVDGAGDEDAPGDEGAVPMFGDWRMTDPTQVARGGASLVEARFVPRRYEPNYAYPLLVLFHAHGGDEQHMVRSMPAMSWRNYVGLSLRGPEAVSKRGRPDGFGWGPDFVRTDHRAARPVAPASEAEVVRKRPLESSSD